MYIRSSAFTHKGSIPPKYTCEGDGMSPPLEFGGVPENAASLVLIMDDPDVPTFVREDGVWDHWVIWNIDPQTLLVEEGTEPSGMKGRTTSGTLKYVPPCPPDREHRYIFRLYALDTKVGAAEGATKKEILSFIDKHIIDQAELIGTYCKRVNR